MRTGIVDHLQATTIQQREGTIIRCKWSLKAGPWRREARGP